MDRRSLSTVSVNTAPSRTLQGPAADCDINNIMRAYGSQGMPIPPEVLDVRYYGDLSDVPDLQTALDRIREASERFASLPSALRAQFSNSPAELWEFVNDPRNADEAVNLGLLKRPAAPVAVPAPEAPKTGT